MPAGVPRVKSGTRKVAWVFPGQGAQYPGMGADLASCFPCAKETFEEADDALGFHLSQIMFEGPGEELTLTENAQPALLTLSVALARILHKEGYAPHMAAGLSLGEYSALVVADAMSFADAVVLTHRRGLYMQEASPEGAGAMAAILGLADDVVQEICLSVGPEEDVVPANYNCPGQVVVSGKKEAVSRVSALAKDRGGKAFPLDVSAPFHSPSMAGAAIRFYTDLSKIKIGEPKIPVYSNVTALPAPSAPAVAEALHLQMTKPVLWKDTITHMEQDGAALFVEVGAGKTLGGFGRRTHPHIPYTQFGIGADLASVVAFMEEAL